jgi:hypothetical protein
MASQQPLLGEMSKLGWQPDTRWSRWMLEENNELAGLTEFFSQQHNVHALGSLVVLFVTLAHTTS